MKSEKKSKILVVRGMKYDIIVLKWLRFYSKLLSDAQFACEIRSRFGISDEIELNELISQFVTSVRFLKIKSDIYC